MRFEYDTVLHGVEALPSDAVDGLFQFQIVEADTGKIVAEVRQEVAVATRNDTDNSLLFPLAVLVALKPGVEYQHAGNYTFLLFQTGNAPDCGETSRTYRIKRDFQCKNVSKPTQETKRSPGVFRGLFSV